MFKVWYSNFRYFSQDEFETIEDAFEHAKSTGFEATIYKNDSLVASWSPISGKRIYSKKQ